MQVKGLAIVVMGVSGCGKSSVGQALAARLGCPMLEGDTFHARDKVEKMSRGIPLDDEDRWPWLDRLGSALAEAVILNGCAIATCSALRRTYRDRLCVATRQRTAFVHLAAGRTELERRLQARTGHFMPVSLLDSQLALLQPPGEDELARSFAAYSTLVVLIDEIADWLKAAADQPAKSMP